jgi:HEPN domain-containing protein
MDEDARLWAERAGVHLGSARALLPVGSYLDVYFHCQQCLELELKALYMTRHHRPAPRIHDLRRLAEAVPVEVPAEHVSVLRRLTELYVGTRYDFAEMGALDDPSVAAEILRATEGAHQWLTALLRPQSE